MKLALGFILLISLLLSQACSLSPQISPTPTTTPTLLLLEETATPTPTITPGLAGPQCLEADPNQRLLSIGFNEAPRVIREFLNRGGSQAELDRALYKARIANQPTAIAFTDLTGDGKVDVVVSIYDPRSALQPPSGSLLIYTCSAGQYVLNFQTSGQIGWGAPGIRYLQDMNADGAVDLVTSSATCGAHTCYEDVQMWVWGPDGFENRLEGSATDLPYPDVRISDPDGDGIYTLEVAGSGIASVGAGPPRNRVRNWIFSAETNSWKAGTDILAPSNFRVHLLHDAEAAALAGDYPTALQLFGRVINDTTLEDWIDPELERANLAAYAMFKTGVVFLLTGQEQFSQVTFEQLRNTYPANKPQHIFVEMAEAFLQGYSSGGMVGGCAAAQGFVEQQASALLSTLDFGYGNPVYTPQDICPYP